MNKYLMIILLGLGPCLYGQVKDTIKDLPAEQLEVVKQFEARLENAYKVNTTPEPPAQRVLNTFDYSVSILPLELEYPEPQIKPLSIGRPDEVKTYRGTVEAGAGNLNTLNGALNYHYITPGETEFGLNAAYLTQENKKERFQKYSELVTGLGITHHLNELVTFRIGGAYDLRNVNFYGSPIPETTIEDTTLYQRGIQEYGVDFAIYNEDENEYDIDYELGLSYTNLSILEENLFENHFLVNGALAKSFTEYFRLGFIGSIDLSDVLDTATISYNNYHIKPYLSYQTEKLGLEAGLDFAFGLDSNYYLPDIRLSYAAIDQALVPYVFWKAQLQKNNLIPLFTYNPFLSPGIADDLFNTEIHKYGFGVQGKFKDLSYDASFALGQIADLILFRNQINTQGIRQFTIEAQNTSIWQINADIQYKWNEQLRIGSHFEYINYDIIAWHLPAYTFEIYGSYSLLEDKLSISPSLFIRDGVFVVNDEREAEELPYMLDLNVAAEYKIADQFSLFIQGNNLLASEYQRWYDYSNFGLNVLGGLRVKF